LQPRGLKERYELHHGISLSDSALVAAASLSDRYLSGRFLPDKAIALGTRRRFKSTTRCGRAAESSAVGSSTAHRL